MISLGLIKGSGSIQEGNLLRKALGTPIYYYYYYSGPNPATLGTSQGVLIRGVASFQGWICTIQ